MTELRCRCDDLNMSELCFITHVSPLYVLVQLIRAQNYCYPEPEMQEGPGKGEWGLFISGHAAFVTLHTLK